MRTPEEAAEGWEFRRCKMFISSLQNVYSVVVK